MNAEEQKAAKERAIFEAFVACEGAPKIETGSVESRHPPEPDILCKLVGGGTGIAFELVEIVESEWAQLISNQIRLQQALYTQHDKVGKPLATEYGTALIYVRCLAEASYKQREKSIPELFGFLAGQANGVTGDIKATGELAKTIRSVHVSRGDFGPGPFFQVEGVSSIGDPTADSIQGKWLKKNQTQHPIELLAYYNWHPTIPEAFWIGPVQGFVEANWATSPFQKVWICDPGSKKILFTAAKNPRWTVENRPLIDGSKPATTNGAAETSEFYFVPFSVRKSVCSFVRQLRGPHLSTCA